RAQEALAEEAQHAGRKRHEHRIVGVIALRGPTLRPHNADNLEGHVLDQDEFSYGIGTIWKQGLVNGLSEYGDGGIAPDVLRRKKHAARDWPASDNRKRIRRRIHSVWLVVDVAVAHDLGALDVGHGRHHIGKFGNGVGVLTAERRDRTAAARNVELRAN